KFISTSEARFQNQDASIRNIETQVGQLVKLMSKRAQGTLPSNTEPNPRGQVNTIFLGSIEETPIKSMKEEIENLKEQEIPPEPKGEETIKSREPKTPTKQLENNEQKEKGRLFADELVKEYKPIIPYPKSLIQNKVKKQYGQFLNILKQ